MWVSWIVIRAKIPGGIVDAESKESIWIDSDGYFWSLMQAPPPTENLSWDSVLPEYGGRTVSLLHFMLRSAMVLPENRSDETWQEYQRFSRNCLRYAVAYAPRIDGMTSLPPPDWATFFHQTIVEALPS